MNVQKPTAIFQGLFLTTHLIWSIFFNLLQTCSGCTDVHWNPSQCRCRKTPVDIVNFPVCSGLWAQRRNWRRLLLSQSQRARRLRSEPTRSTTWSFLVFISSEDCLWPEFLRWCYKQCKSKWWREASLWLSILHQDLPGCLYLCKKPQTSIQKENPGSKYYSPKQDAVY